MPKTSNAVAQACAKVEIQLGCTGTWHDIGGEMMTVSGTEISRTMGSAAVFNDDEHVITGGKKEPTTITLAGLFTSVVTEAFQLVRGIWETEGCSKKICMRWSPEGGAIGDLEFEVASGELSRFKYPEVDAGTGDPTMFEFDIYGYIGTDTIAS